MSNNTKNRVKNFLIFLAVCILSFYFFILYLNYTDNQEVINKHKDKINIYFNVTVVLCIIFLICTIYLFGGFKGGINFPSTGRGEVVLIFLLILLFIFLLPFIIVYYILDAIYALSVGKERKGLSIRGI